MASLPEDGRDVFLLHDGSVRAVVLQGTSTINQMRANHELGILETLVLGHGYLAGGLLASTVKGNDRVQFTIECGGPIKGVYVESWAIGAVRGYLKEVPIQVDKPLESFDLSPFFGPGFMTVTKLLEGKKTPFTGQVMLQHGRIAKDLAEYFLISEQTPTVVSLSIQFDREGRVVGAGGLFLQKMPGSDDAHLEELEMICTSMPSLGKHLAAGKSGIEFVEEVFASADPRHLEHLPFGFSCPCDRKRFANYLTTLPADEKTAILTEGPFPLELHCFNCGTTYPFEKDELDILLR
ncbi:MAG: Hsp33 family molecular chaperone HslO [Sphaerochaetaceae bacterium]|nr:Hsp33 family molecular chaperone HslO [Sphaerochaetaceae bacterium]